MNSREFRRRASRKIAHAQSKMRFLFQTLAHLKPARSLVLRAVCRLEGGQMWSRTYRELMHQYYGVEIGRYSYGPILAPGNLPIGTRIGGYCSFASGIVVLRRNHPVDRLSQHPLFFNAACGLVDRDTIISITENPLTIGNDVWIGQNAIITPSCQTIGDGAIIAAGAVVTADIPPLAIFGGVPARQIRWRFGPEARRAWLESKWWLRPLDELGADLEKFTQAFSSHDSRSTPVPTSSELAQDLA